MRFTLLSLLLIGCSCGEPAPDDPDAGAPDAGSGLSRRDAGDGFAPPDASAPPAGCARVDRISTALPDLAEGQVLARVANDRVLLVSRPNDSASDGTEFRFYVAELGEPFVEIGAFEYPDNVGMALDARWRDGAWDVVVDLFDHLGLVSWLRVSPDGSVTERSFRGPMDVRLEIERVTALPDAFLVLAAERDAPSSAPAWLLRVEPDGAQTWIEVSPPGDRADWSTLSRANGEVVVLAVDGGSPRITRVQVDPLAVPAADAWVSLDHLYPDGGRAREPALHDTPDGVVLTDFVRGADATHALHVWWLDARFGREATWSIDTTVAGHALVTGDFPAQELLVTLPDSARSPDGLATVFHARVAAPGVVSGLSPIGRARGFRPPLAFTGADGRTYTLHFDDRLDMERLCEP